MIIILRNEKSLELQWINVLLIYNTDSDDDPGGLNSSYLSSLIGQFSQRNLQ